MRSSRLGLSARPRPVAIHAAFELAKLLGGALLLLHSVACTGCARDAASRCPENAWSGGENATRGSANGGSFASGTGKLEGTVDIPRLRTDVAPGGNFDLSPWELQEPVGAPKSPAIIGPAALEGPNGYHDDYFYTDPIDGAMTFWAPINGVTTPNSKYPRSELRELNRDHSKANWPLAGTHTLSATLAVIRVPDHVCVGQIHCGKPIQPGLAATTKPLLELYYYANGDIKLGIENSPSGGQTSHPITNVPLGARFTYAIQLLADGTINLAINGMNHSFSIPASFAGYGEYFKAGNYDQSAGTDPTAGAIVKFYALSVSHEP